MMIHKTYAQVWGGGAGTYYDRWTINDDNSNHWSYLRLQTFNDRAWNMVNQGDLWWGYAPNGIHSDRGTEKMRLTITGNLGIGTTNPLARLHVVADGTDQLTVEPKSPNGNSAIVKLIGHRNANTTDDATQLLFQNSDHDIPGVINSLGMISGKITDDVNNLGDLIFYNYADGISSSETMRLTHNGNVGIGTANPLTRFHVDGISYLNGNVGIGTATPSNDQGWGRVVDIHNTAHAKIIATTATNGVKVGIYSHSNWYESLGPMGVVGTESNHDLTLMAGYAGHHVTVKTDGNVGIGTNTPEDRLTVYDGELTLQTNNNSEDQGILFQNSGGAYTWRIYRTDPDPADSNANLKIASGLDGDFTQLQDIMIFQDNGNVGISNMNPTEKLHVSGNIRADGVILNIGTFPDYVFGKDYPLMPLQEVESYINTHKHLPGFPSGAQVVKTGANLGQLNNLLVEKVEELTLYTIAQEKKIDALSGELASLKAQLSQLLKKQ